MLLRDIHFKLLNQFDCKEVCVSFPSQVKTGASGGLSSQDGVPQQQEAAPLCIPQLNRLIESSFVRDEGSASNAFQDLKLMFADSHRAEQLSLRSQQRILATVENSVLRTEMTGIESQEEDDPKRILFFKPMSWLGQMRTHRRDETWSASLWQTFYSAAMGAQIPVIA
jgi:hypothetical protein